ncbi:MAG: SRPBCC family protein [Pseudomonadota bacterium]|nr:SRPBCC family protein [Pseudomonadota bacterium]
MQLPRILVFTLIISSSFWVFSDSFAAELLDLEVVKEGDRFFIESEIFISADSDSVLFALTDYERFAEISSRFKESRFIEPAEDGTPRVYTKIAGCILFFCKSVERVALLNVKTPLMLVAVTDPNLSDLNFGYEIWELIEMQNGTVIDYRYEVEPSFWIPPIIGPWAVKRILNRDMLSAPAKIEQLAQAR